MKSTPRLPIATLLVAAALLSNPSRADEKAAAHEHSHAVPTAPASATVAWGQINGLRARLVALVENNDLEAVHGVTEMLAAVVRALPAASHDLSADKLKRVEGAVNNLAKALDAAHVAADGKNQVATERHVKTIEALLKVLAAQYPAEIAATAPIAVASHEAHGGAGHSHATAAAEPTTAIEILSPNSLVAGKPAQIAVRLINGKTGRPVTAADLEVAHTKRVHLLIIDPSLSDYHHEHPVETAPGVWSFTFSPRAGGEYVVFADLLPAATGVQEYARGIVKVAGAPRTFEPEESNSVAVDGYRFDLAIEGGKIPLEGGAMVKVRVTKPDGSPAQNLEPIMGAFAHGVGFTPDMKTVLHVHPLGEEPTSDSQRGGSELSFHIAPAAAGYYRFYVQVQIDGKDRFAGFGINVTDEPVMPATVAQLYWCPMHPDVTSTTAGATCPKCGGMKLVPKKA
ncbi:MAG: heavy metal-binding domain-containing protein [Verrucomicrobiota bacterium]